MDVSTQDTELLALHHTQLVTWAVSRFGVALLVGVGVGVVVGFLATAFGSAAAGIALGNVAAFFGFAMYLATAHAPKPPSFED